MAQTEICSKANFPFIGSTILCFALPSQRMSLIFGLPFFKTTTYTGSATLEVWLSLVWINDLVNWSWETCHSVVSDLWFMPSCDEFLLHPSFHPISSNTGSLHNKKLSQSIHSKQSSPDRAAAKARFKFKCWSREETDNTADYLIIRPTDTAATWRVLNNHSSGT